MLPWTLGKSSIIHHVHSQTYYTSVCTHESVVYRASHEAYTHTSLSSQTFIFRTGSALSRVRTEQDMGPVVVLVHSCESMVPAAPLGTIPAALYAAATAAPGGRLLLLEVLPEHQIHRGER